MLLIKPYQRENAVTYAKRWAFSQNPLFGDFRGIGGNCTNFVSQCLYAGGCQMNFTPTFGWYYISLDDRTPSWSGVTYFYDFLIGNEGVGPFGSLCMADELQIGDVIQLGKNDGGYYHTVLVTGFAGEEILVSAQTLDAIDRTLSSYTYDFARYVKIDGVRVFMKDDSDCFSSVLDGTALFPSALKGKS